MGRAAETGLAAAINAFSSDRLEREKRKRDFVDRMNKVLAEKVLKGTDIEPITSSTPSGGFQIDGFKRITPEQRIQREVDQQKLRQSITETAFPDFRASGISAGGNLTFNTPDQRQPARQLFQISNTGLIVDETGRTVNPDEISPHDSILPVEPGQFPKPQADPNAGIGLGSRIRDIGRGTANNISGLFGGAQPFPTSQVGSSAGRLSAVISPSKEELDLLPDSSGLPEGKQRRLVDDASGEVTVFEIRDGQWKRLI